MFIIFRSFCIFLEFEFWMGGNCRYGHLNICVFFCRHLSDFPMFHQQIHVLCLNYLLNNSLFQKWLPRPNHYARSIRLEFLCRTPVSKFRELSCVSKSNLKIPNIAPRPECQPVLPGDGGGGDDVPRTLPIWQEPWSITQNQISRSRIPHFDHNLQSTLHICC